MTAQSAKVLPFPQRIAARDYAQLVKNKVNVSRGTLTVKNRKTKYSAVRSEVDGIKFDSLLERDRYYALKRMERAGIIKNLNVHPRFKIAMYGRPVVIRSKGYPNGRQLTVVLDFSYVMVASGEHVVEDTKGKDLPLSRVKRALVEAQFNIKVQVVK